MNVLIIHAHPEPKSFCAALKDTAIETLKALGHEVCVSDLYAMGFNPVASAEDFLARENEEYLNYALEQRSGGAAGTMTQDIQDEISKVKQADLIIFTFPLFWMSAPAILKGWIDRVFVSGIFYGGKRIYGKGGMSGKRALVCTTLGGRDYMFGESALHGQLYGESGMLRSILQGSLGYVGMDVLEPFIAYHVPYINDESRKEILVNWKQALVDLESRAVMPMPNLNHFDDTFKPKNL
jgi:NAD(P)H dehydrogenase (quinone)